jgi:hypothetical protein
MKLFIIFVAVFLVGCATTNPDVEKSLSRDETLVRAAKIALINEMLTSPDPIVRAKAAEIADKFINGKEKKSLFNF